MPPKRRRLDGKEDREDSPGPTSSKKRKKILNYDPHEIIQELYETIRTHKSEDGRILCEVFIRVPKRRTAADYYDVVSTPIDLLKIQQKVKTDGYDYVDQLSADVTLMLNNAKAYYKKTSQEYKDACDLLELYEVTRAELVEAVFGGSGRNDKSSRKGLPVKEVKEPVPPQDGEESEGNANENGDFDEDGDENEDNDGEDQTRVSKRQSIERNQSLSEDISDDLEQLFAAIVTTKDGDRDISQAFQLLPSKSKYPQYHEVIKTPIDLKTIATKIQDNVYKNLDELEKDLLLMVKNAKTFNEPKSIIYRDAVTLKRVITERKRELEYKKVGHAKSSERLRTKDKSAIQKMSAVCAALKYQSEEEESHSSHFDMDSEGDAVGTGLEEDDPQWILFNHVKNHAGPDEEPMSEPFVKLPSKKFYPDYYKEIKKPMSLQKIQCKIEMNEYETLLDLAQDFHLTFVNAKKYNQDESQLYKDAVELDKVMMEKFREQEPELAGEFIELVENEVENEDVDDDNDDDDDDSATERRDDDEEDTVSTVSTPTLPKRSRTKSVGTVTTTPESEKRKSSKKAVEDSLKKRLKSLFSSVFDYSDANGRLLRPIFLVLPSRKDYPDYYQVIMEPIDITMIESKLKADKYPNEQALLSDFELMFNNARHYNEEGSQVYQDANTLDRVLKARWKQMAQTLRTPLSKGKSKVTAANPLSQKLQDLYESIRDFQDRSGRALSSPFIKLPNKVDYPDYYEVIKRPIDMQRILQKMMSNQYENVEDMVSDFVQMFDNACKYNEPESVIYKDSLTLQRVCFQKKVELTADSTSDVPDVKALVQELMTNLFISTYNYEDDEGRCFSDSFAELTEDKSQSQSSDEPSEPPMTFDQIKKNLDKRRYRRVDCFQDDMFKVFERARKLSRSDSQLYEDAVEMQNYFIKTRDELCKNGELLLTPALSYTDRHLALALEAQQKEKQIVEKMEEEEKKKNAEDEAGNGEEECTFKDQTYVRGDFVYIQSRDTPEPHIMVIESFDTDDSGQKVIKGNWFYRPNETYHLATRKFLEKEVFRSDTCHGNPMSEILGRCCVMFVKDYFKLRPERIPDKDIYVCESRYSVRHRCFKKIKIWQTPDSENLTYVQREIPLTPIRVASVFAERESILGTLDESDTIIDKKREMIRSVVETEDGNTYYDQYVIGTESYKSGDGVYISNPRGQPIIARIDRMWTDNLGEGFFHYSCFLRPSDVDHPPTRLFYKSEVFQASYEDCALLKNIAGKCYILHMKEYCSSRPTEIPEQDIYVNECKYQDSDKSIKRQKCLKKYTLTPKVVDDEMFFFRKPIVLEKEPSPLLMKSATEDSLYIDTEDTHELEPEASNDSMSVTNDVPSPAPPKSSKKKTPNPRRQPSGYIVFAGEIRKQIVADNPSCSFGDISKIVGTKWRTLSKSEKDVFEEKAKKIAEEMAAKQQEADKAMNDSIQSQSPWSDYGATQTTPGRHHPRPVLDILPGFPPGHHHPNVIPGTLFNSPSMQTNGYSSRPPPYLAVPGHPLVAMLGNGPMGQTPGPQQCPPSPMFVSVPPQSQKLLHSEAYIRYIEGLESRHISDWDKTLSLTQEMVPIQPESHLPTQWLSQGAGCHGNVTNALWALRDFMLKDALNIARTVPFDDL